MHPRKRRIHTAVDLAHGAHMQTGGINTIDAAGREQVTLFDIGAGRYKFQLQRAAWRESPCSVMVRL